MDKAIQNFPIIEQFTQYSATKLTRDLVAALVVTVMLIPQSLAYSMLAGLPPEYGLYASITPLVIYSLLGSSTTLAVGPVAIASIMTASALGEITSSGQISYIDGAITLALLSGLFLLLLGFLRVGFISNLLSHSVVSGFITASGLLIALSQLKHLLGISASGHNFIDILNSIFDNIVHTNFITLMIGIFSVLFLFWARTNAAKFLIKLNINHELAGTLSRVAPIVGVIATTIIVAYFSLDDEGVAIVGSIPSGLGKFGLPTLNIEVVKALIVPAMLISIIGYVESVSVGRTLATKRKEKIIPNQELKALGGANIASGLSGAFPVTGGFARSVVNFDAGAATQMAGLFTAIGIALASLCLTPYLYYLPIAMLAATIIVAVLSLIDLSTLKRSWQFSKSDFAAVLTTIVVTLAMGVESGVASGIVVSIILHLHHTSKPHIAELGLLKGSEHFRNVKHYNVETNPILATIRVDESIIFSNASYLEDEIEFLTFSRPNLKHVILHCGAINTIDLTAVEMLEALNQKLKNNNIYLHLAEVKVPVKQILDRADFINELNGNLFISTYQAFKSISESEKR